MKNFLHPSGAHSLRRSLVTILLAFGLFLVSAQLLREHADTLALVREDALPLAAQIAPLQTRLSALAQEADLAQRASTGRKTSLKEQLTVYVMPAKPDQVRTVALLEALMRNLQSSGHLRSTVPVDVGAVESSQIVPGTKALPVHIILTVDDQGAHTVLAFLRLTGALTVSDLLTPAQSQALLHSLEQGNPADIVALEQFLQGDVLAYAAAPTVIEGRLLAGVSSSSFADTFRTVQKDSLLLEAQQWLGGDFGTSLRSTKLWPSPFLLVRAVALRATHDEGWQSLSLSLESLGRGE